MDALLLSLFNTWWGDLFTPPRKLLSLFLLLLTVFLNYQTKVLAQAHPLRVSFINPGSAQESFWGDIDKLMLVAAAELNIELEILHANRDHFRMIALAQELAAREQLPRYVILVNEKNVAAKMLAAFEGLPFKTLLLLNDIEPKARHSLLQEPYWQQHLLPPLVPDNERIGFMTAQALLMQMGNKRQGKVLLISGDKGTPASIERTQGALNGFRQAGIEPLQLVYGHWQEQRARAQTQVLLNRYPGLEGIWTANDHMAFGAIAALEDKGFRPGEDIFIASINTSSKVLDWRSQGHISVLGGGHLLAGAEALMRIRDDSEARPWNEKVPPMFRLLVPGTEPFNLLEQRNWRALLAWYQQTSEVTH